MSDLIRQQQWSLLSPLLQEVAETNLFQKRRFERIGKVPASLEEFLALMPFTLKQDLVLDQAEALPYGNNLSAPLAQYVHFCQTSGTTARPLAVVDTTESWDWLLGNWRRGFELAQVAPGQTAYFAFSFGPFLGFWTAFEAGIRMGLRCIPGGGLTTVARLHALLHYRAEVLCCTPTYALHLAEVARKEGVDLSQAAVRRILVAGEPGGSLPAVRNQLAKAWPQAEVIDHYGMTEVGPVAFAVSGQPNVLRVLEDRYLAEVLHPETNLPVAPGQVGELVLTPLGRSAWPLFRYRTGDLVCPRRTEDGLELVGGILGRADDMVIVRGVNLYPGAVEQVVRSIDGILEYRVNVARQGAMVEVTLEVETDGRPQLCEELEKGFEKAFSLRIPVMEVSRGTLPQFELKARRWVFV
ncbi:MAG: AMP-binding protein [Verrucomicrobiota bacterium]